jgi:hypothetical protein
MVEKFECYPEGREKVWIKTPFPVCQNVWSSFVFEIFPEFVTSLERIHQRRHNMRYLNRRSEYDEIADGQVLGYIHAYLPHLERTGGRVDANGLVHVPDNRTFYLEQIQADLEENPRIRTALLNSLTQVHAETVSYLLNQLMDVPKETCYKDVKTTKELRDTLGQHLVEIDLLKGSYTDYGNPNWRFASEINRIPIGELPLFMRGDVDNLRGQTCLDFLRDLDSVLREDRELTPIDLLQIPAIMNQKYFDVVRV